MPTWALVPSIHAPRGEDTALLFSNVSLTIDLLLMVVLALCWVPLQLKRTLKLVVEELVDY